MAKASEKKKIDAKTKQDKPERAKGQTPVDQGKILMTWEARPYLMEKRKTAILLISTLLFSALVWYAFDLFTGILAGAISIGAFSSFLFPSQYQLSERGLQVKTGINAPVFRRWISFKDYRVFPDGVNLNYHKRQLRERLLKAQFVYFGEADAEAIKKIIIEHMDAVMDK